MSNPSQLGRKAAQKQRLADIKRDRYPVPDLPRDRSKPPEWIAAYQAEYYAQPRPVGGQLHSDRPKVRTTIRVDPIVLERARDSGVNISQTCEDALRSIEKLKNKIEEQG